MPHLRLRAFRRLGWRHPLLAAFGAVVAQLQPQPAGERRPGTPGHSMNLSAIKLRATGQYWLWAGLARDPFLTPPPTVGRAAGVPKSLAMPPQLSVRFTQITDRLHVEARRLGRALHPHRARCAPSSPARPPAPIERRAAADRCPQEPRQRPPGLPAHPPGLAGWPWPQEGVSGGQGLRPDPEPRAPPPRGGSPLPVGCNGF